MRYLTYLALCMVMPLYGQAQSFPSSLNKKEKAFTNTDSLFARNFALCFLKDSIRLEQSEIVYFEAIRKEGKLNLSILKGTHSKEVYVKLVDALECSELEERIPINGVKFILYNPNSIIRERESSEIKVREFRLKYSIPPEVEVIKTVFGRTIR